MNNTLATLVRYEPKSSHGIAGFSKQPLSLTVIIMTFNEEIHIERCIQRLSRLARRIIVVDSFSADRTASIAKGLGAEVIQRPFKSHSDQFQWALDCCAITTDWVLRMDADEYLEPEALEEIEARLPSMPPEITGIILKRKFIFMGRWIRSGGYYPTLLLRLWRLGAARIEQRWMDEHAVLTRGKAITFANGDIVDENLSGIDAWMAKHNRYATLQMLDFVNREYPMFTIDRDLEEHGHGKSRWRRFLRNQVYARTPLYFRSIAYFLYRYFMRLGFLDGRQGLVFHALQGLCYMLLTDAKIHEARNFIAIRGTVAFRQHLLRRHGIDVG